MVMNGLSTSIIGRAMANELLTIEAVNIRDFAENKHNRVDDYTYGGGAGMLMQAGPVYGAYRSVAEKAKSKPRVIYLSPQGQTFSQSMAEEFAQEEELIFLCGPCRSEMPDIQKLYETYETEGDNAVIILGVAAPGLGQEKDEAGIKAFLDENGYTYPTLMDTTGDLFSEYGISSFPTTFMIDREGNVFGYVSGALNEDMMKNIIEQTLEGKRK